MSNPAHSKTNLSNWESPPRITTYKIILAKRITLLTCSARLKMHTMANHHCLIGWGGQDLIIAFFPCIYFDCLSQMNFGWYNQNYKRLNTKEKADAILKRSANRELFFRYAVKMFAVCEMRKLRIVMENPWAMQTFLKNNFIFPPALIDDDRCKRGDYYKKPTAYWFMNCEPTYGESLQQLHKPKRIVDQKHERGGGICSEIRSMISPDYARNFIHDFILGKAQENTQLSLF